MESEYAAIKAVTRAAKEKARNQLKTETNKSKADALKQACSDHQNQSLLDILNKKPIPMKRQPRTKASAATPIPVVDQPSSSSSSNNNAGLSSQAQGHITDAKRRKLNAWEGLDAVR